MWTAKKRPGKHGFWFLVVNLRGCRAAVPNDRE
jgi:hypothetical protein